MSIIELDDIPGIEKSPNGNGGFDYGLAGIKCGYGRLTNVGEGCDQWIYFVGTKGPYSHPTEQGCKIGIKSGLIDMGAFDSAPCGNTHLDKFDATIFADRQRRRDGLSAFHNPVCGDVLALADGKETRIIGRYGNSVSHCHDASFAIYWDGTCQYSGGNDGTVLTDTLVLDGVTTAVCWFPHHDRLVAGCRVDVNVTVNKWRVKS